MAKDFAIITIHGMGDTKTDYYKAFETKLRKKVGKDTWDSRVHFEYIYYQGLLQDQQEKYWKVSDAEHGLRWNSLHKFMLYGFSDAASIEHSLRKDSVLYIDVHRKIATAFDNAYGALGNQAKPVFVVAQSLGAQEVSNYLWDAKKNLRFFSDQGPGDEDMRKFRRLSTCKQFITTGCNIPLFKAGLPYPMNFDRPNTDFTWHNYFDADDVLGYPIKKMAPSFDVEWVKDHKVSVGGFSQGGISSAIRGIGPTSTY